MSDLHRTIGPTDETPPGGTERPVTRKEFRELAARVLELEKVQQYLSETHEDRLDSHDRKFEVLAEQLAEMRTGLNQVINAVNNTSLRRDRHDAKMNGKLNLMLVKLELARPEDLAAEDAEEDKKDRRT